MLFVDCTRLSHPLHADSNIPERDLDAKRSLSLSHCQHDSYDDGVQAKEELAFRFYLPTLVDAFVASSYPAIANNLKSDLVLA